MKKLISCNIQISHNMYYLRLMVKRVKIKKIDLFLDLYMAVQLSSIRIFEYFKFFVLTHFLVRHFNINNICVFIFYLNYLFFNLSWQFNIKFRYMFCINNFLKREYSETCLGRNRKGPNNFSVIQIFNGLKQTPEIGA